MNFFTSSTVTKEAVEFFTKSGGPSYYPDVETIEQGTHRMAVQLAEAEAHANRKGWEIQIHDDPDVMEDDADSVELVASGEYVNLGLILVDEEGNSLGSLWSIVVKSEDDPYLRVVAAELASEAY